MKIDVYTDDMLIDGKHYDGKLTVADVIEIVKNNAGNHWGIDIGSGERYGSGAVFLILLDKNQVSIKGGNRFIQMLTSDDKSKILWTKVYSNHIHEPLFIGMATPDEVYEIKSKLESKAVIFKPELEKET